MQIINRRKLCCELGASLCSVSGFDSDRLKSRFERWPLPGPIEGNQWLYDAGSAGRLQEYFAGPVTAVAARVPAASVPIRIV
jgi:hypothetical protein